MKIIALVVVAAAVNASLGAQEQKPVPKDSVRVFIPGCSKGYVFTAGPRTEDQPGRSPVREGTHLRMSGPKAMMAEIKGQEGSMVEITGLIKKGQIAVDGVGVSRGVRVAGSSAPSDGGALRDPGAGHVMIDVEGWRRIAGSCPTR